VSVLHTALLVLAIGTLVLYTLSATAMYFGNRRITLLSDVPPLERSPAPTVSVIVAARDEERGLEQALTSVLGQDYPAYEVIAVNDRSTDGTAAILERMTRANDRLRIVSVSDLPPGWLGKNHALHLGAAQASGEFLVFTDADVVMDSTVLSRALHYTLQHRIDHLAISPRVVLHGFLLNALLGMFTLSFNGFVQPWKARDPNSSKHIGMGAFNLVRAAVYRALGGHEAIRMRPDDDMKLGKLIKGRGYNQDFVVGGSLISVEWYSSLRAMIGGLTKNMFAGADYRLSAAVGSVAALFLIYVWPFFALLATGGSVRVVNALVVLTVLMAFAVAAGYVNISRVCTLALPLAALLLAWIILRSTAVTLWNGGIEWRGTRYPLKELRANKV
jgi:cellulose synthase/poly-beta-1,6-N-acetylglucosamine synthase-like glycosyltransferase